MAILITTMLLIITAYAGLGVVFAVMFVCRGVGRVDAVAGHGTLGFRLLILPGCAALWPILLFRWLRTPEVTQG